MVRRSPRWRAPKEEIDHTALFAEEAKRIVRSSGLLAAHRKSSGLLLQADRSAFAREQLELAGQKCAELYVMLGRNDRLSAMEIAARQARLVYTGHWWTAIPCDAEPIQLGPGDEYFSRMTVSKAIERMGDPTPDRVG